MTIKIFDWFSKLLSDYKISFLIEAGGVCGKLLLLRPIIFLIFSRQRDLEDYGAIDMSAVIFIIYSFAGCFFALSGLFRSKSGLGRLMLSKSALIFFILYSIICFFSMLWSVNLSLTGFRAFECLSMMLMIVMTIDHLFSYRQFNVVIQWSMLWVAVEMIISIIKTMTWSSSLSDILQSNQMFIPLFFFFALLNTKKKLFDYLVIIFSIFSMSTVAYIGMALGLIGISRGGKKLKAIAALLFIVIGLAMLITGPKKLIKETIFFDKQDISLESTTGRNHLMEAAFECVAEHPFGLGFFAAEPFYLYSHGHNGINAHNSIFSALMGCGYIGAVTIVIFLLMIFINCRSNYIHKDFRAILFCSLCIAFIECMGNPSIGSRVYGAWIAEMYIFCMISAFYCYGKFYNNRQIL